VLTHHFKENSSVMSDDFLFLLSSYD